MAAAGVALMDAARAMDWKYQRVQQWELRSGLKFKRGVKKQIISEKQERALRSLAAKGCSLSEAARELRWSSNRVWGWEKRLGLQFRRVKPHGPRLK